jgi:outer membrane lipoprotein-sorting protein
MARQRVAFLAGLLILAGCAPKPPVLPTGAGDPFPDFASAYQLATAACGNVSTITASMALSGKAGSTKLHGRIDAGFEAPSRARLEGIPPFGKPVFVLVADETRGTLVLSREDRVLRDAPPDQIVEALAGVALGPAALRTIVSGCGFPEGAPTDGRAFAGGQASVSLPDGTTYLRRAGDGWQVAAATHAGVTIMYADYVNGRPSTIRLRAEAQGRVAADLTLRLSDVEVNAMLDPKVFVAELPEHPVPMTLEEVRKAGPLGGG